MRSPSTTRIDTISAFVCCPMTVMQCVRSRSAPSPVTWSAWRCVSTALFQIQLAHQLEIAVDALQDGVDDQGLAAVSAGEQICVSARRAVEELAKNHVHLLWLERCRFCGKDVLSGWMSLGDGEALLCRLATGANQVRTG